MAKGTNTGTKSPTGRNPAGKKTGANAPGQKTYVIAIGIDTYDSPVAKNFPNGNCRKDCEDLVALLTSAYEDVELFQAPLLNEKATRTAFEEISKAFLKDESKYNNINSNLVLYFSGHGGVIESGYVKIGCWIPYGAKQLHRDDVITNSLLLDFIESLKTQHFLLISDSCKSGKIFDELVPSNQITKSTRIEGREISRWAIVSSRSDELSKSGGKNENSQFTKFLLKVLKENKNSEMWVTGIIDAVSQYFVGDEIQKPFSGRLNHKDIPNSGYFVLKTKPEIFDAKKSALILRTGLMILNYDEQSPLFDQINPALKKQIAFFSGTPSCGLSHLSLRARKSGKFPTNYRTTLRAKVSFDLNPDNRLLATFNAALNIQLPTIEALSNHLNGLLNNQSLLFEFLFDADPQALNKGATLKNAYKKELIDQFAAFVNSLKPAIPEGNAVFLFVIDEDRCDFNALYPSTEIAGVKAIILPEVSPVKTKKSLTDWYNLIRLMQTAGGVLTSQEFDSLFNARLRDKLDAIFDKTKGYPGDAIKEICSSVNCIDLALELLEPRN